MADAVEAISQVRLQRVVADIEDLTGPPLVPAAARQHKVDVAAAPRSKGIVGLRRFTEYSCGPRAADDREDRRA